MISVISRDGNIVLFHHGFPPLEFDSTRRCPMNTRSPTDHPIIRYINKHILRIIIKYYLLRTH